MSFTLGDVIQGVRLQHPAFGSDTVPNRVLGHALGLGQQKLAQLGYQRRPTFLSQTFAITFAFSQGNTTGIAGAGTSGGLPSLPDSGGTLGLAEQNVGIAPVYDLSDPTVLASRQVITLVVYDSGTDTTTLTFQGSPAWTVDAFVNDLLWIVDGPGNGSPSIRSITANTADTVTIDGMYDQSPVANESVGVIIAVPPQSSTLLGVATALPGTKAVSGYLVKLDAQGNPFLDLTNPVVATTDVGIPLPPMVKLLGATLIWSGVTAPTTPESLVPFRTKCNIVPYANRFQCPFPSVYLLGNDLYLVGWTADWSGVQSLELRYAPIPPLFGDGPTAVDEYFLLPDYARFPLEAWGAYRAAQYAIGKGQAVDLKSFDLQYRETEATFVKQVGQLGGAERMVSRINR